jgi:MIP family channel proteins
MVALATSTSRFEISASRLPQNRSDCSNATKVIRSDRLHFEVKWTLTSRESNVSKRVSARLLAEFIGTFAFVLIGAGAAAVVGDGVGMQAIAAIAFAHGLTIMAFAFAYGPILGGHMNPAVTVGVLIAGAMRANEAASNIVAQLVGGVAAALVLRVVLGGSKTGLGIPVLAHHITVGSTFLTITPVAAFVIEAVLAFLLVTIVLSTAVAGRAGNLAPLAIGLTVTLNIIMGGPLTGGAFNPARALGPMVATGNFADAWLYLLAPVVGAIVAAILHKAISRLVDEPAKPVPADPAE